MMFDVLFCCFDEGELLMKLNYFIIGYLLYVSNFLLVIVFLFYGWFGFE